jgi:7-keto-8-aminopelargonate synthetase-like enzyme
MGPKDLILYDALSHNCIVMGAKHCGAARRSFPHNDLDAVEAILAEERDRFERVMIVSEGLFSMDGDCPDLSRLIDIKRRYAAVLMVDDAHGLGVLGRTGRGVFEQQRVRPGDIDLWAGTLSKTLVSCGGYVAASHVVIDLLRHHAPGFVYSVGLPAGVAVAATTALEIMLREPGRVDLVQARSRQFFEQAQGHGLNMGTCCGMGIIPVIVGDPVRTVALTQRLFDRNINTFPVLPPGVPDGSARIRFFISAAHTPEQIDHAVGVLAEEFAAVQSISLDQLMISHGAG